MYDSLILTCYRNFIMFLKVAFFIIDILTLLFFQTDFETTKPNNTTGLLMVYPFLFLLTRRPFEDA